MSVTVALKNVSKRFTLRRERAYTVLEFLTGFFRPRRAPGEEFWALKDVDFEIPEGQTFGVIGPNGAGKSTMLKLMAGIVDPTSGQVVIQGRISPLLEVGAGFHPELTGRENIHLNAALFGLSGKETRARFDEIVEFSELGDFIDVPLKHYSTGMYMRLGFSVAANIIPDILLVDEVLAVGDEAFQRKCLAKIEDFRAQGRTIVFVSHDLPAVRRICHQALWLDKGRMMALGPTDDVVDRYLQSMATGE